MNFIKAFDDYAEAFEVGVATRDWSGVAGLMADDVVWTLELPQPLGGTHVGRDNVIAAIRRSVDGFDRRFDLRKPQATKPPEAIPGGVYLPWRVTYSRRELPDFALIGEEWDLFHDGRMTLHYERFHNAGEMGAYLKRHHAGLLPPS